MNPKMTPDEVFEEVRWLLDNGCSPEEAAGQLGRSVAALEKLARRHGRPDMALIFNRVRIRTRYAA